MFEWLSLKGYSKSDMKDLAEQGLSTIVTVIIGVVIVTVALIIIAVLRSKGVFV